MTRRSHTSRLLMAPFAVFAALLAAALSGNVPLGVDGPDEATGSTRATGLDADLAARLAAARKAAAAEGIDLEVTSGWRSAQHQRRLFREAVAEHGSRSEASRWVLPPHRSAHVRGLAIDVGPADAMAWLEAAGAEFGLCRVYENEPWHFEPLTDPGGSCPDLRPDGSVDAG